MPGAEFDVPLAVVDASVVVRWIVPERGAPEALALLGRSIEWIAPHLVLSEVAYALRRKVLQGEISVEFAEHGIDFVMGIMNRGALRLHRDEVIIRGALTLALAVQHKVPDCLYFALAEHTGAGLATADRRLSELAETRYIPCVLLPSA
jgi:predicted nucleic acid-binding protein